MMKYGLRDEDLLCIINVLKGYSEIEEALIFGSRAKGCEKVASDVDIALKGCDLDDVAASISGILNDCTPLPYTFDVIAIDSIDNEDLKEHIRRVGCPLY